MAAPPAVPAPPLLAAPPAPPIPDPHHVLVATSLVATVEAAAQARAVVQDLLRQGHRTEMADTACLLTSELVTNALVHAGAAVELVVDLDRCRLTVEVVDGTPTPLVPVEAGPHDTHGRGLALVDRLADSWGVTRLVPGKAVWFALATTD